MIERLPYQAIDANIIDLHPDAGVLMTGQDLFLLSSESYTFWDGNDPIYCFGVAPLAEEMAMLWALPGVRSGPAMPAIFAFGRKWIADLPYARIEAAVPQEFAQGHRWMLMLGFELETPKGMRRYYGAGTWMLYARVKNGWHS